MDFEKKAEFLLEQAAVHDARMATHHEQFMAEMAEIRERQRELEKRDAILDRRLDRAIRMSVEEHRRERVRRQKLERRVDAEFHELRTLQAETQKSLKAFIDSMKQGRNGHDKA